MPNGLKSMLPVEHKNTAGISNVCGIFVLHLMRVGILEKANSVIIYP